jgi:hypothetical protein
MNQNHRCREVSALLVWKLKRLLRKRDLLIEREDYLRRLLGRLQERKGK